MLLVESPKFGCLMLFLSATPAEEILQFTKDNIPPEFLAEDGYEQEPHTTVLFGFHPEVKPVDVERVTQRFGSITVELGEISRFDTDERYDVIKVDVESEALHELHACLLAEFDGRVTNTFPEFHPHLTLAYVKKGSCQQLDSLPEFFGREFTFTMAVYSTAGALQRHLISLVDT